MYLYIQESGVSPELHEKGHKAGYHGRNLPDVV